MSQLILQNFVHVYNIRNSYNIQTLYNIRTSYNIQFLYSIYNIYIYIKQICLTLIFPELLHQLNKNPQQATKTTEQNQINVCNNNNPAKTRRRGRLEGVGWGQHGGQAQEGRPIFHQHHSHSYLSSVTCFHESRHTKVVQSSISITLTYKV